MKFAPTKKFLRKWTSRIGNFLRAAVGWLPITPLGLLTLPILGVLLKVFGISRQDKVVLALTGAGLFFVALAIVVVFVTAIWVRLWLMRQRSAATLRLEAGTAVRTGFHLGRVHWNPLLKIDAAWELPEEAAVRLVSNGRLEEEVTPAARAWCGQVVRRITLSDVLGLARVTFRVRRAQPVQILPRVGNVGEVDLRDQVIAGEGMGHPEGKPLGDLIETRKYSPGDPLKLVLWKVYARTGRMLVRVPERSVAVCDKVLTYMVAGPGDENSATVARTLLERGILGRTVHFGSDATDLPAQSIPDALENLAQSASARGHGGAGLASFLDHGAASGIRAAVLFVPAVSGKWLPRVVENIRAFPGPFQVVVGIDEQNLRPSEGRVRRWLLQRNKHVGNVAELHKIAKALENAGAHVRVVNSLTGTHVSL